MLFNVSEEVINKKLAEALDLPVAEVEAMSEDFKAMKMKAVFEGYVLDESDSVKGSSFYKFY